MSEKQLQIDSGILQFAPKGAFYEEQDEQFKKVFQMWQDLFDYDRTLFCLTTLLGGTGYSKGAMSYLLLSNPQSVTGKELVPEGLAFDFESKVIKYNLTKERTPRALKNLLMLTGKEGAGRVNNSRTRKIILEFIFNREHKDLDNLAVNYKGKLKKLVRHALGKQDLYKILSANGDSKTFDKWIGKVNPNALPIIYHLFDVELPKNMVFAHFEKVDKYQSLKEAAKKGDIENFKKQMDGLPLRTVMGFRNTYKIPIELKDVYKKSKVSSKEALQSEAAAKRSGTKIKVNYKAQDIYDLWKAFYFKVQSGDLENIEDIADAIDFRAQKLDKIDLGETVVIVDASRSMYGSDQRPLHPFLTSLSILSILDNVKDIIYVGGKRVPVKDGLNITVPAGATDLWRGLVEAVIAGAERILVVSDGYENAVKGMFDHVYKHFKDSGYEFELMHINPVFSADAKSGTTRKLAEDVTPLPVTNYKFLETEIIFNKMIENREVVKKLLINKYQKLIGN